MSSGGGGLAPNVLIMFFALLVLLEFYNPREKLSIMQLRTSYQANIKLFGFNSVVMSFLSFPSLLLLSSQYADRGLLKIISDPIGKFVVSFLAMDLMLYGLHKASHSFDCLWMLHKVHHNDPSLNVSTAFRLHFLEIVLITSMKALLVLALGIEGTWLMTIQAIITIFTMLHHTNISLLGEKLLGWVIITPYLHCAHHSNLRKEHDHNYGAVLSLWDRLFGTLTELKPVKIGVEGYVSQDFVGLITCGSTLMNSVSSTQVVKLEEMIAEAAYYKAEKRGFYPGNELSDWLEAKREIINLVNGKDQVENQLKQKWQYWSTLINKVISGGNKRSSFFHKQLN
jgi:sterol desaturase/sphingolipid hydroxylase (fatty acid hydroxylase superfamily)